MVFKWLIVARNEYRIRTSRIRRIRSYFPYLVVGLLALYLLFLAPVFVGFFIDDFLAFILSQVAVVMMQIIFFMLFIYFMIIPITDTLREEHTGQVEIFLAAPIKPSDVLLGEFLGEMPFYSIFITIIIGFFTSIFFPLGLDIFQIIMIVLIFILTILSALWIGNVVAAILRTKLGKTARGRDIGRALAMIIALPLVALYYALQFGGFFEALTDPGTSGIIKIILGLFPSSWGAMSIIDLISNPGNIGALSLNALLGFGGVVLFFITVLWLGSKMANRAYSLEPTSFVSSRSKPDGFFYKSVRYLGGRRSFGSILTSIFKDYSRRLENLSNIMYILGLLVLINLFIIPNVSSGSEDLPIALIMAQFMFPILVVMVVGGVTVQGKEALFIFKKAPFGVKKFVKARLLQSLLVITPIVAIITFISTVIGSESSIISIILNICLMLLIVAANVSFTLGVFLLNPPFSIKSVKLWVNIIVVIFVSMGLFAISILILSLSEAALNLNILSVQLLQIPLSWLVGIILLYLGARKLSRTE
jgi:hypothetical protein